MYLIFSNKILNLLNFIVAYFLNPRFQYRYGVGSDPELLQAVHDVFAKLDPTIESLGQFGNEVNKKKSYFTQFNKTIISFINLFERLLTYMILTN